MKNRNRYKRRRQAEQRTCLVLICFVLAMGLSLFFYIRGQGGEKKGRIGNVDFEVREPLGEKLFSEKGVLVGEPGQTLAKDPTIYLERHSAPAYLRVRILWGGLNGFFRRAVEEKLMLKKGWEKNPKDGYYYYQYIALGGEQIPFFDSVEIPERLGDSGEKIRFCMEIHVEAAETDRIEVERGRGQKILAWKTGSKL